MNTILLAHLFGLLAISGQRSLSKVLPSIHGVPESERVKLDEAFLGKWHGTRSDELVVAFISKGTYEARVRSEKDGLKVESRFSFGVVRIGEETILDVTVAKEELAEFREQYGALIVPSHVFMRLSGNGDRVTLYWLDDDWMLQANEIIETKSGDGEGLALWTTRPHNVFAALTKAAGTEDAWEKAFELTRQPAVSSPAPAQDVRAYAKGGEGPRRDIGPDLVLEREEEQYVIRSKKGYFWSDVMVAGDERSVFAARNKGSLDGWYFDAIVRIEIAEESPLSTCLPKVALSIGTLGSHLEGSIGGELNAVSHDGQRLLLRIGCEDKERSQGRERLYKYMPFIYDLQAKTLEAVLP